MLSVSPKNKPNRNVWPNSKIEATKCVVPFGAVVTPRKPLPEMPVVPYDPVRCKGCAACLNPYARVDFNGKLWICPFCYTRNHFPPHYSSISETNLPAELFPTYTTIEVGSRTSTGPLTTHSQHTHVRRLFARST